jgi:glycosyltransferase involved in cell wall biosynthesis
MMQKKVSLYIPCYNAEEHIERCITGVLNQTYPIEEIIIVDDGSIDRTVEVLSKYPVKVIRHESNKGLAAARNTGVLNAKSEFVASLDADCLPKPDWLEKLMNQFSSTDIAGVGGRLIERHTTTAADRWRAAHMCQNHGDRFLGNASCIFGNNNIFRKDAITSVGLYNTRYRTNYEDMDLSKRLKKKGYKLVYEPKAIVWHYRKDTVASALEAKWRYRGFGSRVPATLGNLLLYTMGYFAVSIFNFSIDLLKMRFILLPIDIIDGFYSSFLGINYYLSQIGKKIE